ncbi:MAG TPA: ABC transporter substrate-binding protein [Chloroflexota bacterium]|jgi:branched-chain amino acid transport system substrate-binding protein|nr:ABC transporter substrate-binding protein [Chloroflexota bacterium]
MSTLTIWGREFRKISAIALALLVGLGATTIGGLGTAGAAKSKVKAPYVIGAIGTLTGTKSGDYGGFPLALTAWVDATNAHGGISGHKVKLISLDDQGNPSLGLQDAQQLVQQDHVIAVMGTSDVSTAWGPYLQQQGIPVIGGSSANGPANDPLYFTTGATFTPLVYGSLAAAAQAGGTKIGIVYCTEAAVCASEVPIVTQFGSQVGLKEVYSDGAAIGASNYTSYCIAAQQAGANVLDVVLNGTSIVTLYQNCASQGYFPIFAGSGPQAGSTLSTGMPANSTSVIAESTFPWFLHSTPATEAYYAALKKYVPSIIGSTNFNPSASEGWVAGAAFGAAAKNLGSRPTARGVIHGLYTLRNFTLGGLIGPTTYIQNQTTKNNTIFVVELHNGTYSAPDGMKTLTQPT